MVLLRSLGSFLILSALFAIAYSQSPLYTSNQNQYFLHGLAAAGYGYLDRDWLANTLEITPVFSKLVELTYRLLHQQDVFYVFYALLMGVYLYSLAGIAGLLFELNSSRLKSQAYTALFIAIHSAGLRFALSRWLGTNWTYVLEDGVADQRMLGPVLQPSAFGVFLALSVYLFLRRKPYLALVSMSVAVAFHPTYLLGAAILTLAYALIAWIEGGQLKNPIRYGLVALALVSPMLYYIYTSFSGSSPETAARAQEILVNFRIPHHALASQWFDTTVVAKLALVTAAITLAFRRGHALQNPTGSNPARRLGWILLITSGATALLTLLQIFTGNNALALLFPWRLSILIVPVSTALLLAYCVDWLFRSASVQTTQGKRLAHLLSAAAIFLAVLVGGIRFALDLQRKAAEPERALEAFIYAQKSQGDVYLTPLKMQDFRLATGAPAFIDFKSIPYRDSDVLEWRRRVRLEERFYSSPDCNQLESLSKDEGITHIVLEITPSMPACTFVETIYKDEHYMLWRIDLKQTTARHCIMPTCNADG